jgi:PKD repeat protein
MSMRIKKNLTLAAAASGLLMLLALGCSADSPTAPTQEPIPPAGGTASAAWRITVSLSPREMTVGSDQPTTVTIQVVRADNNQPPATGTTIVARTSLGEFFSLGSGTQAVALATAGGFATVSLFPGNVIGTAFVTAQLEASVGRAALPVVEEIVPVVAAFETTNSNENLSVQFLNTSEGSPTKFRWDFGDGATSNEENPSHLYALPGDYPVTLTASKRDSEDSVTQIVTVNDDLAASFEFNVNNLTVVFRDTSEGNPTSWRWDFGDGSVSSLQNPTHTYRREGFYVVTLKVRKASNSSESSQTVEVTEEDVEDEALFITDIDPESGPGAGGTKVTITGTGFVGEFRVFFGGVLAEPVSRSGTTKIVVRTPPGVLNTEPCDDNNDDQVGQKDADTAVSVKVELQSGTSETVDGGFTYLADVFAPCNGD